MMTTKRYVSIILIWAFLFNYSVLAFSGESANLYPNTLRALAFAESLRKPTIAAKVEQGSQTATVANPLARTLDERILDAADALSKTSAALERETDGGEIERLNQSVADQEMALVPLALQKIKSEENGEARLQSLSNRIGGIAGAKTNVQISIGDRLISVKASRADINKALAPASPAVPVITSLPAVVPSLQMPSQVEIYSMGRRIGTVATSQAFQDAYKRYAMADQAFDQYNSGADMPEELSSELENASRDLALVCLAAESNGIIINLASGPASRRIDRRIRLNTRDSDIDIIYTPDMGKQVMAEKGIVAAPRPAPVTKKLAPLIAQLDAQPARNWEDAIREWCRAGQITQEEQNQLMIHAKANFQGKWRLTLADNPALLKERGERREKVLEGIISSIDRDEYSRAPELQVIRKSAQEKLDAGQLLVKRSEVLRDLQGRHQRIDGMLNRGEIQIGIDLFAQAVADARKIAGDDAALLATVAEAEKLITEVRALIALRNEIIGNLEIARDQASHVLLSAAPVVEKQSALDTFSSAVSSVQERLNGISTELASRGIRQSCAEALRLKAAEFSRSVEINKTRLSAEIEPIMQQIDRLDGFRQAIIGQTDAEAWVGDQHGQPEVLAQLAQQVEDGKIKQVFIHGDAFDRGQNNIDNFLAMRRIKDRLGANAMLAFGNHDAWLVNAFMAFRLNPNLRDINLSTSQGVEEFCQKVNARVNALMAEHNAQGGFRGFDAQQKVQEINQLMQVKQWLDQGGRVVLDEFALHGAEKGVRFEDLAMFMMMNFELFRIDAKGLLHLHAGIPMDDHGNPAIARTQLDGWARRLADLQQQAAANPQLLNGDKWEGRQLLGNFDKLFDEAKNVFWVRLEDWLDKMAPQFEIDAANRKKIAELAIQQWNVPGNQAEQVVPNILRKAAKDPALQAILREAGINFIVHEQRPVKVDILDRFCQALGIAGVVFGHEWQDKLMNVDNRLICLDVHEGENGMVIFNGEGLRFVPLMSGQQRLEAAKADMLTNLDRQIIALKKEIGIDAQADEQILAARKADSDTAHQQFDSRFAERAKKWLAFDKNRMLAFKQGLNVAWGEGTCEFLARVSTTNPDILRIENIKLFDSKIIAIVEIDSAGKVLPIGNSISLPDNEQISTGRYYTLDKRQQLGKDARGGFTYCLISQGWSYRMANIPGVGMCLVKMRYREGDFVANRSVVNHRDGIGIEFQTTNDVSGTTIQPVTVLRADRLTQDLAELFLAYRELMEIGITPVAGVENLKGAQTAIDQAI